jgi:hypothetical protein
VQLKRTIFFSKFAVVSLLRHLIGRGVRMDEFAQLDVAVMAEPACVVSDAGEVRLFSFRWLEEKIENIQRNTDGSVTTRFERYVLVAAVVIGAVTVLAGLLLRNDVGPWIFRVGIALDWVCVALIYLSNGSRAWRSLKRQHRDFAKDLDDAYPNYRGLIDALREFSATDIGNHLRYLRDRKEAFLYRYGLIIGSAEKLGFLPVIAVLYLQLKDWSFNEWAHPLRHVRLIGGLLLWMLLLTYLLALWGARTRDRLGLYVMLLAEAAVIDERAKEAAPLD